MIVEDKTRLKTFQEAQAANQAAKKSGATTVVDRRGDDARNEAQNEARNDDRLAARRSDLNFESQRAPAPSSTDRRYVPQGELARGGMGAVFKVWDRDLGRTLAMKVLLDERGSGRGQSGEENLARFLQEAQVIARLDHPGIVPVHDVGFDLEGRPYFTMRYVDGLDLDAVFDRARADRDGWNRSRALASIVKTCQTVAYAHARGIIHRDLKPGNVMVGRFGEVYVIDWGLAKILHKKGASDETVDGTSRASISRAGIVSAGNSTTGSSTTGSSRIHSIQSDVGVVVGTPPFMPPEQAEGLGGNTLDPRSDIYSLGAILYTLLTGDVPYAPRDGRLLSAPEMTDRVLEGPPPPVRELAEQAPAELVAICEKAMSRDPSDRYRSALDMGEELQSYLDGRVIHPTGVAARLKGWVKGNRAVASFAAVAIFLVTLLPGIVAVSSGVSPGVSQNADEQTQIEEQTTAHEPETVKKCSVAKSHAECGDAQSS